MGDLFIHCMLCMCKYFTRVHLGLIGIILIPAGFFISDVINSILLQSAFLLKIIGVLIGAFTGSILMVYTMYITFTQKSGKQFDSMSN